MSARHAPAPSHSPRTMTGERVPNRVPPQALSPRQGERLRQLLDILTEGVALCAVDGRITHRNRAIVRMLASAAGDLWLTAAIEQAAVGALRSGLPFFASVSEAPLGRAPLPNAVAAVPQYELHAMVLGETLLGADAAVGVVVRRSGDMLTADELRTRFGLTRREVEVVWLLARGHSNAAVARALGLSPCTARHYTEHALDKLGVSSRAQVAAAIRAWPLPRPRRQPPPSHPSRNSLR